MAYEIPDTEVEIRITACKKCKGWITCSVWHMMDEEDRQEFYKEASEHELDIKTIPLLEWRTCKLHMCKCK
ncbi:hypothetical protein [uncultured Chryseobacterium sp.]|uniref:hypothetical protein n=1 Tax=uncultured Chryseobacterium sp. TaxID=259322 RepID=UPI002585C1E5|nr:hypothetical protein [uncultured Chryseobacterium sp.]